MLWADQTNCSGKSACWRVSIGKHRPRLSFFPFRHASRNPTELFERMNGPRPSAVSLWPVGSPTFSSITWVEKSLADDHSSTWRIPYQKGVFHY